MTYGIELFNQFGEELVATGRPLYVKETATAAMFPSGTDRFVIGATGLVVISGGGLRHTDYPAARKGIRGNNNAIGDAMNMWRFAASAFTAVSWSELISGRDDQLPETSSTNVDDLVFWEMPTSGIVHAINYWIDPPDASYSRKVAAICPQSGEDVQYCIASRNGTVDLSQSYGIQTFAASGNVLYDSRADNVIVRDFRVFSQAEVQDVLENDSVITFTPRVAPLGSPMVSLSPMMSFRKAHDNRWQYLLLEWDGTNFTLSRIQQSVDPDGIQGFAYNGFTLTVADAEW